MANKSEYEFLIKILGKLDPSVGSAASLTKRQLAQINGQLERADKFLWGGLKRSVAAVGAASIAAGTATVISLKKAYDVGSEFEKHMDQWSATADATQAQYEKARKAAMLWGRQTTKTATEGADALQYMALAGWDVNRSVGALPKVLKLSEATNLDLAKTSSLVVDSMAATATEAKNLPQFLDVVAKANNKSNQSAEQLLEAYIKTGATLANLRVPVEESATAFGMLANRGKKAEEAGVGLRSVLINLTTGQGQAGKAMEKLGISAFDENGRFIGLKNTLIQLNEATRNLTEEQRNAAFSAIGGKRQVDTLNDLMQGLNHTLEDGQSEWDALYEDLTNAHGALDKMAAVRMDNLWGDIKIFQSSLQDAGIRAYDGFAYPMRDATQLATKAVYEFSDNVSDKIGNWYPTIKRTVGDAAEDIINFSRPLISMGKWLIANGDSVAGAVVGVAGAITLFHGELKAAKLAKEFANIGALFMNPVTSPLVIIPSVIGLIGALAVKEKLAAEKAARANLAKHFGDIALSEKQLRDISKSIIGEKLLDKLTASMKQINDMKDIGKNIDDAGTSAENLLWKVKQGLTFSTDDKEGLQDSIQTMIDEGLKIAEQSDYTLKLSVKTLFGDDSKSGDALLEKVEGYNNYVSNEIRGLGAELGEKYAEAMADGVIEADEAELIENLIERYQTAVNEVTKYKTEAQMRRHAREAANGSEYTADSFLNLMNQLEADSQEYIANLEGAHDYAAGILESNRQASIEGRIPAGEEGYISQVEYENQMRSLDSELRKRQIENNNNILNYAIGSVNENYDLSSASENLSHAINEIVDKAFERAKGEPNAELYINSYLNDAFANAQLEAMSTLPSDYLGGLSELRDAMAPQIEELRRARDELLKEGLAISPELKESLDFADELDFILSDTTSLEKKISEYIMNDADKAALMQSAQEEGKLIPQWYTEAVQESQKENEAVQKGISEEIGKNINSGIEETLTTDFFYPVANTAMANLASAFGNAAASNPVKVVPTFTMSGIMPASTKKNALGGIYSSPILTEVAEAGDTEAIIPINNSSRAAELYRETGKLLSAEGNVSGEMQVVNNLNINVSGTADSATLRQAARQAYEVFVDCMEQYQKNHARLSY